MGTESLADVAPAVDAHVHLMPERLLEAIQRTLNDELGWTFPHPTTRAAMEDRLRAAGVDRYFALPYAHKPGMARELNEWVLTEAADSPMAIPFASVHGDDEVEAVVREAFEAGAAGLKFQCPVQGCGPADPRLDPAFELAAEYDRGIVFHAGTAPHFDDSPHVGVDQFEAFVASYPEVRTCAAHLGAHEADAFVELAREHAQVFLDTTMALSPRSPEYLGFDPETVSDESLTEIADSLMYGSDFPNLPYAYEDERAGVLGRDLSASTYERLFGGSAARFLGTWSDDADGR